MKYLLMFVLLVGCTNIVEPENNFKGQIGVYGNEPFAYLGVLIKQKVYVASAKDNIVKFLYKNQGVTIKFEGYIKQGLQDTIKIIKIDGL